MIERDLESGWLVGEVVELPGCYTQAPDEPTFEAHVKEAIRAYLKMRTDDAPLSDYVETRQVQVVV